MKQQIDYEKIQTKKCDMNVDELKIKALLEGLEAQDIEKFMRQAKVGDYRNYGKAYFSAVRNKIEEKESKPLFITEDGVEITDGMQSVIAIDSDINVDYTRYQWANKTHLIFGSKEGADQYIWRNKRLFSYNDIKKFQSGGEGVWYDIKAIAKERNKE